MIKLFQYRNREYENVLYFGDYRNAGIFKSNKNLTNWKIATPSWFKKINFHGAIPVIAVDYGYWYVYAENLSLIFKEAIYTDTATSFIVTPKFSSAIASGKNSFVLRVYDSLLQQNDIVRMDPVYCVHSNKLPVLIKQKDGFFCTDGMLRHASGNKGQIVYTYFYRNEMISLDSSFNMLYTAHTIDTTTTATFSISNNDNWQALSSPERVINKASWITADHIIIYSSLRGDNESRKIFADNAALDVYALKTGQYLFSFYVPVALSEWGHKNNPYYEKAMMMRALENTIYFASSNYTFLYPESASSIISPEGTCIAHQTYGKTGVLITDIDTALATGLLAGRYKPWLHA
jgi:hypothetical protein